MPIFFVLEIRYSLLIFKGEDLDPMSSSSGLLDRDILTTTNVSCVSSTSDCQLATIRRGRKI